MKTSEINRKFTRFNLIFITIITIFCFGGIFSSCEGPAAEAPDGGSLSRENEPLATIPDNNGVPRIRGADYNSDLGPWEGLSAETERQIKQAYLDSFIDPVTLNEVRYTLDDVWIAAYYGTYNGCVAVMISRKGLLYPAGLPGGGYNITVANTLFIHGTNPGIITWKNGQCYSLQEAYDQGFLTQENLRNIAYNHHFGTEINLAHHAALDYDSQHIIKLGYYRACLAPLYDELFPYVIYDILLDDGIIIDIERYYGSYRDYYAVMVSTKYDTYDDTPWEITVAGTTFHFDNGNKILVWKYQNPWVEEEVGNFYTLQEAYDLNLLTQDDIKSIAYYHENGAWIKPCNYLLSLLYGGEK